MNNTTIQVDDESLASRAEDALQQLLYSAHAFSAVVVPVSISIFLASLAVVFVNDGLNGKSSGGIGIPVVFEENTDNNDNERFVGALVNALAIIGAIIGATFLMVFLYYFKFMKLLIGWLVASTGLLLAFSTGLVVQTGMSLLLIPFDAISYSIIFYNFAIVGVTAVFYQKGIPHIVTGGYLVIISVTMAWILLRYLPEWTSWALLALLAFYDLCAVLTPCGPLKWLVGIMQERDEPLPGLLYEARVRQTAPGQLDGATQSTSDPSIQANLLAGVTHAHPSTTSTRRNPRSDTELGAPPPKPIKPEAVTSVSAATLPVTADGLEEPDRASESGQASSAAVTASSRRSSRVRTSADLDADKARVQKRLAEMGEQGRTAPEPVITSSASTVSASSQLAGPTDGVQDHASVYQHQQHATYREEQNFVPNLEFGDEDDRSIKLGLGDFVFYSLLCARAALVSFTTFVAVYLVVLFGLAMTLVLLAVYRTALPALPISILLGLVFFFAVDAVVVPFVNSFALQMAFT